MSAPCKPWCGTRQDGIWNPGYRPAGEVVGKVYCTAECRDAGRPLCPSSEADELVAMRSSHALQVAAVTELSDANATLIQELARLRGALEHIKRLAPYWEQGPQIARIAREALATPTPPGKP